ncbi:MAG: DUF423 domain-containing protein [Rhodospirillales bacterium]|nr:DUF423 domain-containing protein [Rhodospirillales bacterium]MBN8899183.1 DUF423 domain-containing protein [Rhodospirillales bacterium]
MDGQRVWALLAGVAGCGAVAMAAVGAHALQGLPEARIAMVRSGIQMQGWHALALFGAALWVPQGGVLAQLAAGAFLVGMLLFCGAVYAHGLADVSLGMVAPTGGTLLMLGWLLLGASALRVR